jgi:CRP-like cAMP-binding protein
MESLARVPLFRDLNRKTLERIERAARPRSFKAGEEIVKEGDEGVGFYLITSGAVGVTRGGTQLNTLRVGDFFGEMVLLEHHRRTATVTASEPTECLVLLRSDFVSELRANSDLAIALLAVMARRLRELDEKLAD